MRVLYVGKCLFIEEFGKKILVVGDLHLGYEESLNRRGVFVSRQMFDEMISYFEIVFSRVGKTDYVILLGDVKHEFGRVLRQEWKDVLSLFDFFENKLKKTGRIIITKGNHDKILEPIVRKRKRVEMRDIFVVGGFCFFHGDKQLKEMCARKIRVWVMGHGHPAVKISDGVKVEKYKCFLVGRFGKKEIIIVPSFFSGNVGSDPRENELGLAWNFGLDKFNVYVVGEGLEILSFGKLGKLR